MTANKVVDITLVLNVVNVVRFQWRGGSCFSTSAGVRYSRERRSRLDCLRGGVAGEGASSPRGGPPPSAPAQPDFPILEYWGRGGGYGFLRVWP